MGLVNTMELLEGLCILKILDTVLPNFDPPEIVLNDSPQASRESMVAPPWGDPAFRALESRGF